MPTTVINLIRCMKAGNIIGNFDKLVESARLNKVLLGFLRRVGYKGSLRTWEEYRYRRYMNAVAVVAKVLSGLDYAFFKFRKPVEHVSVDIDILINGRQVWGAVRRLEGAGFNIEVLEPYTVTMIRGGTIVDLYTHPSFAWIVYLDGERLLEEAEVVELEGVGAEVIALGEEAEAVVAAAHAVYKEHVYLLADYYVTKKWTSRRALSLARELNVEEAVRMALKINEQIEEGLVEAPVKLSPPQVLRTLASKFVGDSSFRASSLNLVKAVSNRRMVRSLIQRMKRETY